MNFSNIWSLKLNFYKAEVKIFLFLQKNAIFIVLWADFLLQKNIESR